jgi:hypothetical protein
LMQGFDFHHPVFPQRYGLYHPVSRMTDIEARVWFFHPVFAQRYGLYHPVSCMTDIDARVWFLSPCISPTVRSVSSCTVWPIFKQGFYFYHPVFPKMVRSVSPCVPHDWYWSKGLIFIILYFPNGRVCITLYPVWLILKQGFDFYHPVFPQR